LIVLLFCINVSSQIQIITTKKDTTSTLKSKNKPFAIITTNKKDTISNWKKKNILGVDISEIAFVNWSAGGTSAITGLIHGELKRDFKDENQVWSNELIFRYGLNKQQGTELRKSDDVFRLNSTYGYKKDTLTNWYHSAKFNFNTQFANGYNYPNTENAISKPFAPAYTFLGIGSEYINKQQKFKLYLSPFTLKNTAVLDQELANAGAFGVKKAEFDSQGNMIKKGEKSRTEFGILITSSLDKEIFKNIFLKNRLTLFTDYIHNFGNIDVDWAFLVDLKVNQYVKANIGLNLIYDEDIDVFKEKNGVKTNEGAKVQLKQVLGIGLEYTF
jgi:hypothetical protein